MGQPLALRPFHVGEYRTEERILRAAGVDAEVDFPLCFMQVADSHLPEHAPILGTFDTKIVLSPA